VTELLERLEEVGELDAVGDNQPERLQRCDDALVGTKLEIRWRYWTKVYIFIYIYIP
jgi:hypothetical protein